MAFWLERILSSKRLVCNKMQTGPISSLPSPWQLSKCLRRRPHNCVQFQGCRGAPWEHLLASTEPGAAPRSENRFIQSRNGGQNSEALSRFGRRFRGQLFFLSLWQYPHFDSLALPNSNPERISLTLADRHGTVVQFCGKRASGILRKTLELRGFSWGKASLGRLSFLYFYCFGGREST